ncbi:MAG: hypothetical protein AB1442_06265, partial [Nitrospirota bacterium]
YRHYAGCGIIGCCLYGGVWCIQNEDGAKLAACRKSNDMSLSKNSYSNNSSFPDLLARRLFLERSVNPWFDIRLTY